MAFMRARHQERRFFTYFFAAVGTKNAGSIFEHALHGLNGEGQGWLS